MKNRILHLLYAIVPCLCLAACDVHEFPSAEQQELLTLKLNFNTDLRWSSFDSDEIYSRSVSSEKKIRCIIRFYEQNGNTRSGETTNYREFFFTSSVSDFNSQECQVAVEPGDYRIMVWADYLDTKDGTGFYDAIDFADIKLQSPYTGNSDYRDAFRGTAEVGQGDFEGQNGQTTVAVEMSRPLAKYEFISTDLKEFLIREMKEQAAKGIALDSYRILFFYEGYLPVSYSMFTDKPVDSTTGISFEGSFTILSDEEVSLGFDYVFVNHKETTITVKIGLFNQAGELVSLTKPIDVPLKRSTHTLMRGRYLMEKANSSVSIDPSYDDEYNIIF